MSQFRFMVVFCFLAIVQAGCGDLFYFSKMGWHQGSALYYSVPVEQALDDGGMSALERDKVRFIQEVKRYGEEKLGLKPSKNYTTFLEVKGPLLYVISACEKDRLRPYSWNFPIIGQVSYKSFFTVEDVANERASLDGMELDTYAQRASAYSTLGWLKDPILSSMLNWDHTSLANLILHEMTHGTVYFKGDTALNEQVATFIGNRGAIQFLSEKYGADSKQVIDAKHMLEDDVLFGRWIDQACRRLDRFYGQNIARDEKLKGREDIFRSLKEEFREIKTGMKTETYSSFERVALNNAVLLAYHRYTHREAFDPLYERLGRDLSRVVGYLKMAQSSGKSSSALLDGGLSRSTFGN